MARRIGIDSISLNPDTAIKTALIIAEKEARQQRAAAEMAGRQGIRY